MQKQSFILNKSYPSIELNHYTKRFRTFVAVNDLTFKVPQGVIHGFIGPNGSGKTTSIKAMIGAYIPTAGQIRINGHRAGTVKANGLIGYIPERASFPKHLNTIGYLKAMGELSRLTPKEAATKAGAILNELKMLSLAKKKPTTFSSGMQKKILLAQSLITNPSILILDEPAANLDPTARKELFDELIKLRNQGKTILISSHILAELERIVDEVTFLYKGRMTFSGKLNRDSSEASDIFIKTSDNWAVKKFIEANYKYPVGGDLKTEISIKGVPSEERTALINRIVVLPNIVIETMRTNDLQSFYDKLVLDAENDTNVPVLPKEAQYINVFKRIPIFFRRTFLWVRNQMHGLTQKFSRQKKNDSEDSQNLD